MGFRVLLGIFFGGFLGMLAVLVSAGQASAGDADDLIRQGVERRRQRDDVGALRLFEQAYQAGHSPRALAQMALAEQALGKWVSASEHLRQALAIDGDSWIVKNHGVLKESAARVAEHVGWIEIFGGPPGAEVRLDSARRGTLPLPRPLAATTGTVAIDLWLGGAVVVHRTTTVRAGETTREAFETEAIAVAVTTPPRDGARGQRKAADTRVGPGGIDLAQAQSEDALDTKDAAQSSSGSSDGQVSEAHGPDVHALDSPPAGASAARIPLVVTTGALAMGALVFAVIEHTTWYNKGDSFNGMGCNRIASNRGGTGCEALYNDGHRAELLTFVGYGAAGALAATSVALFFVLEATERADRQVACSVDPSGRGMGCALRF
jgi:hypothetical protein